MLGNQVSGGIGLGQQSIGGTGMGIGASSGLRTGGTSLGLGAGGTGLPTNGSGLGIAGKTAVGMGGTSGFGVGGGLGLNQSRTGMGLGTGGLGTGLQTSTAGLGMALGQTTGLMAQQQKPNSLGLGLGTGQQSGMGMGLGQTAGIGSTGLGLGSKLGAGMNSTGMGLGTGLGTGLGGGTGTGLGTGLGSALKVGGTSQSGLGGLSLAGTQRGTTQGIFTQTSLTQPPGSTQQQLLHSQLMLNSITMPGLFGDERDITIQKFNQLEAYCGTGKGLTSYGGQAQLVPFTPQNPFARFKTICYSRLPSSKNEDGLVGLQFKKPHTELMSQDSLEQSLQSVAAHNAAVQVVIDSIKPLPDNCSEVTIYIMEQSTLGSMRRVLATSTCMYLHSQQRKTQLESLGVTGIYPKTGFSEEELKIYLSNPPEGITNQIWEQSKKENPDPQKYIPVPIVGSGELLKRIKYQRQECQQHEQRLQLISNEITELNQRRLSSVAKISEYRRKLNDLSHRILRVMVVQEKLRRCGWSIQPVEEQLRIKLEGVHRQLDSPVLLKGRLSELLSQIRLQGQNQSSGSFQGEGSLVMDPTVGEEINEHLFQQQGALSEMVKILKQDFKDLALLEDSLKELTE